MKIALLEPYYGGSHKYWADLLISKSRYSIDLYTLPARHWKWRMQGSALSLAQQITTSKIKYDLLLVSSMIDLSWLKSLLDNKSLYCLYMHENQLAYPVSQLDKERHLDLSYGYLNYKSCMAADYVIFNSHYHREVFFEACKSLLDKMPDFKHTDSVHEMSVKSTVLYPGILLEDKYYVKQTDSIKNNILLWNHRWEHDKMPEWFLDLLEYLDQNNVDFKVIITSSVTESLPDLQERLFRYSSKISHIGYIHDKKDYWSMIGQATLLPVSPGHDYFGISVLEAVFAGVTPLLPRQGVYEEHFDETESNFYSNKQEFFEKALNLLTSSTDLSTIAGFRKAVQAYDIKKIISSYDQYFEHLLKGS